MNLIIITGFLGSGKTTLLLEIAKKLSSDGKKVAIIENEVGELGIDDCIIRENGYDVREIYSGCICCSLRMDLITTLLAIEREYSPDIVILEPSGVAGPKQVISALQGYGGEIEQKIVINIVDASRYHKLENLDLPIIQDGLETAEIIVLNKKDLVSETELCELRKKLGKTNYDKEMISVSMVKSSGVDHLIEKILSVTLTKKREEEPVKIPSIDKKMPEPAVFTFDDNINYESDIVAKFADLLTQTGQLLHQRGAIIGHLKIMLNGGKNGYVLISLTSPDHPPVIKGKLRKDTPKIRLRLNAIAYNISNDDLKKSFDVKKK